ncbi:hypothetical protein K461DRAFT_224976 [Myriangium duriaei CBS 260.36]|uniref:Kinetochore protein SPC25 n=1 Tax=Myriangium duriaei CBS 260.36 TaxID=1168546 RepID=A0A9P4J5S2_9PEZI|nr:hypothetical protein K461DRAFT_224976 [Myriangium duriaei CBS 260.36]
MTPLRHDTPFSTSLRYDSPADTLPSIDFNFADLRERMALFTSKFDDFISRGRLRVLSERNAFRASIAEQQESQRAHKQHLDSLSTAADSHADTLAHEAAEAADLESAIAALSADKAAAVRRRDALTDQIRALQADIASRRAAQNAHAKHMESQARLNGPELRFWEQSLGLRIEGAGAAERIRFVFCCVDERDEHAETDFVLDMRGAGYKVEETMPALESEEVDAVVERLNEGGDLAAFLKGMRTLFVQAVNER